MVADLKKIENETVAFIPFLHFVRGQALIRNVIPNQKGTSATKRVKIPGEVREMPFWRHGRGPIIRKLVKEEEYSEIASLASKNRNVALELVRLLDDPESEVWENAAEAIGRIGGDDLEAPQVLKKVVMPELAKLLKNSKAQVREAAALALSNMASNWLWEDYFEIMGPAVSPLIELLNDSEVEVRKNGVGALKWIAEWIEDEAGDFELLKPAIPQLSNLLKDSAADIRGEAVWALRAITHIEPEMTKSAIDSIIELLEDSKDYIRLGATLTLRYMAEKHPELVRKAVSDLLTLLEDSDERIYGNAATALGFAVGEMPEVAKQVVPYLVELLEHPKPLFRFREEAVKALGKIGEVNPEMIEDVMPVLRKMLEESDEKVRKSATKAIQRIEREYI